MEEIEGHGFTSLEKTFRNPDSVSNCDPLRVDLRVGCCNGPTVTVLLPQCRACKHYNDAGIFELCMRANATYSIAGKEDQHTVGHMRQRECAAGQLFEPRA